MRKNIAFAALVGILLVTGCARDFSSSSYEESEVGSAAETYPCTVVSVCKVKINAKDSGVGTVAGALVGAAAGSQLGGGNARFLTGGLGALAGGVGGHYAEKSMMSQEGYEYTVSIDNMQNDSIVISKTRDGKASSRKTIERKSGDALRTVVQGLDVYIAPGSPAYLKIDPNGRSRVVPR
ncbi:MAG: glycine zipper 2TM domain-containing protein [Holosporaceae bacterium]|jgi:outer membrane lipoprotein SlyB|nr:glycine zipper 2TM domain-containing protein [Holosporaceae bacterium]